MRKISRLLVRKLNPSVNLNRINSAHLLKHLENVCEHIFEVGRYNIQKPLRPGYYNRLLHGKEKGTGRKRKVNYIVNNVERNNKLFQQVYQYFDKAKVLLPEFGPTGILRLLYALLKIRNFDFEKNKRKKATILKYIEYYILRSSIHDEIYNFWKHITLNDIVLLFKMFIKNNYFSYELINKLINEVINNVKYSVPSDLVIFLCTYHVYKSKIKFKRYKIREVCLSENSLKMFYKNVIRNNSFDITNKEMCNFITLFSLYGKNIPLNERVEIYKKSVAHIKKTKFTYSPDHVKNFIISFFRIHNFIQKTSYHNSSTCSNVNTPNEFLKILFELYNKRNIDVKVEEELYILDKSLKNCYYDYDSLDNIIFNIKNNISHLNNKNKIKFINLVAKLRNVYNTGEQGITLITSKTKFIDVMLRQILSDCVSFINMKYKLVPWSFRHVLLRHQLYSQIHMRALPNKCELGV
ncbi:hypothetical protein MKS88_003224 [Plasmodium brasilianum]|uniref:Uncharacterized protein n=2 Tax=Plasmodium (Plasmodium) TaxID=418103 RepID=A0A1A8WW79_PLAMA|nr:conserved Plasmodium protein, unknown function [Plasmodium malariae]KAI4837807.1 hypothetical protein MKS88_003224 [Plasmodium brasilianum]SBS95576.1 hypothetical protein PMALA_047920 [Plasmodium malariae]SCN44848.1 conserved Plasmodium protein, unknown function [Plasmodium malariae]